MNLPPPLPSAQQKRDADHLRLLAVFHFVFAGLALLGIGFLALHYGLMQHFLEHPDLWKGHQSGPPPAEFFFIFKWIYFVLGMIFVGASIANLLSGLFIHRRINRLYSLIIAGINCIQIPFGTALGIFTLIVLLRDSVREHYAKNAG